MWAPCLQRNQLLELDQYIVEILDRNNFDFLRLRRGCWMILLGQHTTAPCITLWIRQWSILFSCHDFISTNTASLQEKKVRLMHLESQTESYSNWSLKVTDIPCDGISKLCNNVVENLWLILSPSGPIVHGCLMGDLRWIRQFLLKWRAEVGGTCVNSNTLEQLSLSVLYN